ncbi:GNAT superfamily N-acetyltransferase [Sphingomonas endophytica]|uniref:GNAT superfamily N-acetyltransferase n=1 Tax=Sphingomonas endophytica TaxID=869719 RepID=A0A7X0JE08_9SPHN|nr:GNAT family N-acetyltransferase [Sphingomonas endophytica]MBB6505829.1 GNAT superfamily N-acetyltransferase [Sphingomonas endophytica]
MDWRLRRAGPADAAALSLVAGATFLEAFAGILDGTDIVAHVARNSSAAAFGAYLFDDAIATLAEADAGAAPIGYTLLTRPDLPVAMEPGDIELKRIYALFPTHGSGLGPALMARAIDDARARGHHRLLLGVYGRNRRAQRFYEKQGFTVAGTRRFRVGATWHDDLIYARAI